MNQKSLLKTLLLLCALVVGSGSAWADTYSLTPDQQSTGSNSTSYITTLTEFTYNGITWKMNQWNPNTLQIRTNQASAESEFRFYNTSAFPGRISRVVIKFSALTVSDASKLMFLGGTSAVEATTGGTAGIWNSSANTLTWTPGDLTNFTYFAFYQDGKAASGTNKLAAEDAIVVTYETASATYTVTYDANRGTGTMTDSNSPYAAGATVTVLDNTFTRDNYTFSKWNTAADGTGTDYAAGATFTINANTTLYAQWTPNFITATLTASNLELSGTSYLSGTKTINGITYSYTDLMPSNGNIQAKASTGTIGNATPYPENITRVIITHSGTARATTINGSADGTNWTQVATGSGSITADFSGKGYKYFQITRGSNAAYWTKIEVVYPDNSSLVESDFALTSAPISLSFDLFNRATPQVIRYTTSSTGEVTIPNSPYATFAIDQTSKTITVTPKAVTPSAQTITVNQSSDATYRSGMGTFSLTITDSTPGITFDATVDTGDGSITKNGVTFTCDDGMLDNGSEYRLYKNSTTTFSVDAPNKITSIAFTGASSNPASNFSSQTGWTCSGDNGTWTGSATSVNFTASSAQVRATRIVVTVKVPVTITSAKYATFSHAYATDFSGSGITVYTAVDNENSVTLNEITSGQVPANTPVVLYKADADGTAIDVPVIASAEAIEGTNDLCVSTGTDVDYMYVLAMNPTIGFYRWAGESPLSAGKVYLQGKASYGTRMFIGFGEGTSIRNVNVNAKDNNNWYDLQGRRVAQPTKGLYIVNGKKVLVK